MTIPTRQAPPIPVSQQNRAAIARSAGARTRYAPATDWDDQPFHDAWGTKPVEPAKKTAPPRPPPPKVKPAQQGSKKPSSLHSNTILSNLMSRTRLGGKASSKPQPPPKPPVDPPLSSASSLKSSPSFTSTGSSTPSCSDKQLISFDSPPGSPTFTQKSNSDCVSVDSFSSDSNYSPNNGFSTESGFEDDFVLDNFKPYKRMTPIDPFDLLDEAPPVRPPIAQKPLNIGNASFYAGTQTSVPTVDTLCNGKNLISVPQARAGPTIIRAVASKKPQAPKPKPVEPIVEKQESCDSDETPPSPPMPKFAPPPPPKEYFEEPEEPFGVALYDFPGEQEGDLPLREGEKVYLVSRASEEWLFGRNRRGCEGLFPANFVEIKVPLPETAPAVVEKVIKARVLFDFDAETVEDLTLRVGDEVIVLHSVNEEWLFGEIGDRRGQFPANFVEYI